MGYMSSERCKISENKGISVVHKIHATHRGTKSRCVDSTASDDWK